HAGAEQRRRDGHPDPTPSACAGLACGRRDRRGLRGAENRVRRDEGERQLASEASSGWPGASGRFRMPSRVTYFEYESCNAAMSSGMNRGEALTRATTAPGTSPSSTSCSMRAKVSVNSYGEKLTFAKFAYVPPTSSAGIWMLSRRSSEFGSGRASSSSATRTYQGRAQTH